MLRLAAQLDLTEPGGVVVLAGAYAPLAGMLAESFPALYAVLNGVASSGAVSALAVSNGQPFAAGSVRAVALDAAHAGLITEAHRMLRTGGRLVSPADAAPGDGLQVIARDERELVALSTGSATPVIPLRRR